MVQLRLQLLKHLPVPLLDARQLSGRLVSASLQMRQKEQKAKHMTTNLSTQRLMSRCRAPDAWLAGVQATRCRMLNVLHQLSQPLVHRQTRHTRQPQQPQRTASMEERARSASSSASAQE